jgi:S-adenosyl methyltransferase
VLHSARIWNYWLGGKDNHAVDREAGDQHIKIYPGIVDIAVRGVVCCWPSLAVCCPWLPGGRALVWLCAGLHGDRFRGSVEGHAHDVGEFVAAWAGCGGRAPAVGVERAGAGFDGT